MAEDDRFGPAFFRLVEILADPEHVLFGLQVHCCYFRIKARVNRNKIVGFVVKDQGLKKLHVPGGNAEGAERAPVALYGALATVSKIYAVSIQTLQIREQHEFVVSLQKDGRMQP